MRHTRIELQTALPLATDLDLASKPTFVDRQVRARRIELVRSVHGRLLVHDHGLHLGLRDPREQIHKVMVAGRELKLQCNVDEGACSTDKSLLELVGLLVVLVWLVNEVVSQCRCGLLCSRS